MATSIFRLSRAGLKVNLKKKSESGTKKVIGLSTLKGLVLWQTHYTPTHQSLKTSSGSRGIDSCFDSQEKKSIIPLNTATKVFLI